MKSLRKAPLSVALAAAIAGMAAVPSTASAFSIVTEYNFLSPEDSGDVLLFPFYSAVGSMETWFSLTNTSYTQSLAVKIRFREQKYSLDIWDTIVFLSPNDHFGFGIRMNDVTGVPEVIAAPGEESCSLATNFTPANGTNVAIPVEKNGILPSADWPGVASVGHVEVIAMADLSNAGWSEGGSMLPVSLSDAIKAKNEQGPYGNWTGCYTLKKAFGVTSTVGVDGILGAVPPPDTLIGRYVLTAPGTGIEAGGNPIVLRNAVQGYNAEPFPTNFLVNFNGQPCSAATANCVSRYAWDKFEADHPHLGDMAPGSLAAIDDQLETFALEGDWSVNPATNISLDWLVSFPTKYVYTDILDCAPYEGVPGPKEYCGVLPYGGLLSNPWTGSTAAAPMACVPIVPYAYGLNEEQASIVISPVDAASLCNEVNVVTFNPVGNVLQPSMVQTAAFRKVIPMENMDGVMGWARMYLGWKKGNSLSDIGAATWGGLFIMRDGADPNENNASLTDLARYLSAEYDDELLITGILP